MIPRWRQLAQSLLPEVYGEERPDSLYAFFSLLRHRGYAALRANEGDLTVRVHAFADWCARHREKYIWNAAGVGFYEHLFDGDATIEDIAPWLSQRTFADIRGLLEWRLGSEKAKEIDQAMKGRRSSYEHRVQAELNRHLTLLAREHAGKAR